MGSHRLSRVFTRGLTWSELLFRQVNWQRKEIEESKTESREKRWETAPGVGVRWTRGCQECRGETASRITSIRRLERDDCSGIRGEGAREVRGDWPCPRETGRMETQQTERKLVSAWSKVSPSPAALTHTYTHARAHAPLSSPLIYTHFCYISFRSTA